MKCPVCNQTCALIAVASPTDDVLYRCTECGALGSSGMWKRESNVLSAVEAERNRQDEKWGPWHDDSHSISEFVVLIQDYAGWARVMSEQHEEARKRLVQVAALAVAAIESVDRKQERAEIFAKNPHSDE